MRRKPRRVGKNGLGWSCLTRDEEIAFYEWREATGAHAFISGSTVYVVSDDTYLFRADEWTPQDALRYHWKTRVFEAKES